MSDLPGTWAAVPLGELGTWRGGGTPSKSNPVFWNGKIPWVSPKDMKVAKIRETRDQITAEAVEQSAVKLLPAGSVVIVTRSGILAHTLPVATTNVEVALNQDLKGLVLPDGIDAQYVALGFRALQKDILDSCSKHGTTVHSIELPRLMAFEFPVAPLNEQHRIVAKIEELFSELDKGVESLRAAREQLKVYRQASLKYAFEGKLTEQWREESKDRLETADQLLARIQREREARYQQQLEEWRTAVEAWEAEGKPGKKPSKPRPPKPSDQEKEEEVLSEVPNGWGWIPLGALNVDVFDGPFGSNLKTSDYVDEGVRVIRLENIGYLEFIEEKRSYITPAKYEGLRRHTVRSGDVVFSSFISHGIRVAVLPESIDRAVNKADCFCVRLHGETVRNDYLASFLSTRAAFKQIEPAIHGVGRPRINTTQLKGFVIPLCGPDEQAEIMSLLRRKLSLADSAETEIDKAQMRIDALRQSVLKEAFSGRLVEQDASDEPASILLERIEAEKSAMQLRQEKVRRGARTKRQRKKGAIPMKDLVAVLESEGDWVKAGDVFRNSGLSESASIEDIERFYRELRDHLSASRISVERRGGEDWLRLNQVEPT